MYALLIERQKVECGGGSMVLDWQVSSGLRKRRTVRSKNLSRHKLPNPLHKGEFVWTDECSSYA